MNKLHDTPDNDEAQPDLLSLLNRPVEAQHNEQPADLGEILSRIDTFSRDGSAPVNASMPIREQFEQFHANNPAVYKTLRWLARDWQRRTGGRKIGFPALYERARWELGLRTDDATYLLNNNYRPYYSRLLMAQEPDLAGMFEIRRSPEADEWIAGHTDLGRAA
ncbi:hypothetical protein [Micromonospora zamorensis]|uniref:hypothetical protein n=1 Tax=Micromonospora zamorensis TaxID=709883 RepID=UPI0037B8F5CA